MTAFIIPDRFDDNCKPLFQARDELKAEIERLAELKAKREDMLGEKVAEISRLETENRELQQHLHLKLSEVERLRGALEKIANVYPCSDLPSMARLARETLGA